MSRYHRLLLRLKKGTNICAEKNESKHDEAKSRAEARERTWEDKRRGRRDRRSRFHSLLEHNA